jgi:2'-5' RNA ligase
MRTFIAIDLPEEIKERVYAASAELHSGVTTVAQNNLHITLQFLGEKSKAQLIDIENTIKAVNSTPFLVSVYGVSYFGKPARVIFANVADDSRIAYLYSQISVRLAAIGIESIDSRKFVPHITMARVKHPACGLEDFISRHAATKFGSFEVSCIAVKKSTPSSHGPVYETLYERKF